MPIVFRRKGKQNLSQRKDSNDQENAACSAQIGNKRTEKGNCISELLLIQGSI